ncbi:tetratricopeptide repeat-containing sensor histidine kinase [Sphingobacterium thalpophilum]|uniref:Sensor protein degS n=1 Tax=Sphingobacterium thalpophilum TaxID=259 RepID=A0A4U9VRA0_9SPHI|nr:ATP-binding protein [Sphingobacterium thalpophilum]VTR48973.1 Sensor protein degS [Sphingobacterium thalpophilum]
MVRKYLQSCILFFVVTVSVQGQPSVWPDDIRQRLERCGTDRQRAKLLFQLGDSLSASDTTKSLSYIRQGLELALGDALQSGVGYFYLGRVYMDFSPSRAERALDTALQYLEKVGSPESYIYQSRTWANKAVMAQLRGDNRRYIDLFLNRAIPLAAKGGDSLRVADGYTNVALPFMNYGEYDKAVQYLKQAASMFERLAQQDLRRVDVYSHLAKVYLLQGKLPEAGENIRAASKALERAPQSIYAPNFHAMESMYLIRIKRWKEAEQTVDKGLSIAERLRNRYDIRQLLYQKAELFRAQRKWKEAKETLLNLYHSGYIELSTDKKQLFGDLAGAEESLGNYKAAYIWLQRKQEISEEMYAQETKAKIAGLEAKYNYVQKEKELILARTKASQQRAVVWIIAIIFIIILVFLYFWYRNRKLRTAREIENLRQRQRIELGKALLEGEEKERGRLARDLHDGLGGTLAGIKLNLSQLVSQKRLLEAGELNQTIERLGHSVNELRRISRNMMPESLIRSGLAVALRDLCDEAALPGLKVSFKDFGIKEDFTPQVKVMIYRIVQELVYNAVKYASASRIIVQCSQSHHYFFITVEDNGHGFSTAQVPHSSRGLKNIQNRVDLLGGKMEIDSSGKGTNINIELYVGQ